MIMTSLHFGASNVEGTELSLGRNNVYYGFTRLIQQLIPESDA